eukprot:13264-Heterococcus_DN1.PRE.3
MVCTCRAAQPGASYKHRSRTVLGESLAALNKSPLQTVEAPVSTRPGSVPPAETGTTDSVPALLSVTAVRWPPLLAALRTAVHAGLLHQTARGVAATNTLQSNTSSFQISVQD